MLTVLQIIGFALLTILAIFWVFKKPVYLLSLPLIFLTLGQLARLPIPISNIGILASDLLIPLVVALWFFKKIIMEKKLPQSVFGKNIWIFIFVLCVSLLLNVTTLPSSEILVSCFYLIRFVSYLLFFFVAKEAFQNEEDVRKYLKYFAYATIALSILGIIQFIFVPDFRFMAVEGWDPHIGRLLSTWFDPNYLAGFFALVIGIYLSIWYMEGEKKKKMGTILMILLVTLCFVLTYSRSGIVALGIVVGIIGIIKIRSILIVGVLFGVLALSLDARIAERFSGLVEGGMSVITGSLDYDLDITSQKRVESWMENLSLLNDHYLYGMGYNTLEFRKLDKGIIASGDVHSASGSDSSLLNILLTTGIIGLLSYCYLYWSLCRGALFLYLKKGSSRFEKGFGLGMFAGLVALIIHSFFVNSLLFPLFLMTIIPLWAALDTLVKRSRESL